MYQNPYMNPNGFVLRTPVYQRRDSYRTSSNGTRRDSYGGVSYPPPVILSQQDVMSGPGAYTTSTMRNHTPRNTYDSSYRTPVIRQPPWSNPNQRYDGRNRGQQTLPRKRVFDDSGGEHSNKKQRREEEIPSTSKRPKSTNVPSTQTSSDITPKKGTSTRVPAVGSCVENMDVLSNDIWENFLERRQSKADLKRKVSLRNDLVEVIKALYPYGGLFLVGSSMSGFGSTDSDVDMCLMISDTTISQKNLAKTILYRIQSELCRTCYNFVRKPQVIPAKVPILKFYDCTRKLECDLNINNATGIRNTYLMQLYSKLDWRVAPLILTIKQWASNVGINDASKGTLSSYSIVLMVLYYLQVGAKPPVLISLQQKYPRKFENNASVWDLQGLAPEDGLPSWISFQSTNKQTFRQLLEGFLTFYTTSSFRFHSDVVSVRLGGPLLLSSIKTIGDWNKKFIHIEEPFDKTNTARAVYSEHSFKQIMSAFRAAASKLNRTKNLKVKDLLT